VIHERLVAKHGFTGSYQQVKLYVAEALSTDRCRARPARLAGGAAPPVRDHPGAPPVAR